MVRSGLVERLLEEHPELGRSVIEAAITALLDRMGAALADGDRIELRGFGSFSTVEREPYAGRNPATGQAVQVPAKRSVAFRAGRPLRDRLNPHLAGR